MADTPILVPDSLAKRCELEAIRMYREKYPDGPEWQTLASSTGHMWVAHAEKIGSADHGITGGGNG